MNRTRLIQTPTETLAKVRGAGSVDRTGPQLVRIRWHRIVLEMRSIDLCVLGDELARELQRLGIDAAQDYADEEYIVTIKQQPICLTRYELPTFAAMVRKATESLPDHVIRWREITLSILPRSGSAGGLLPGTRN